MTIHHVLLLKAQYRFLQYSHSTTFPRIVVIAVTRKYFSHFFPLDFTIVTGDGKTKYTVYCFQALNLNSFEYLRFTSYYGKVNKNNMS